MFHINSTGALNKLLKYVTFDVYVTKYVTAISLTKGNWRIVIYSYSKLFLIPHHTGVCTVEDIEAKIVT